MLNAFNQIYGAFKGFLSQDFWYTIFVPLALFSLVHFLLLTRFAAMADLEALWLGTGAPARLSAAIAALVLLGYVLQSFLPMLRGLLDGTLLPAWLHDGLRQDRLAQARQVRDRIWTAQQLIGTTRAAGERYTDPASSIKDASAKGRERADAPDAASVDALQLAVDAIDPAMNGGGPIGEALLLAAEDKLVAALAANDDTVFTPAVTAAVSAALRRLEERYSKLIPRDGAGAIATARIAGQALASAPDAAAVTALGAAVEALERMVNVGEPITQAALDAAEGVLIQALRNNSNLVSPPARTGENSAALRQLEDRYNDLLPRLTAEATYRWQVEQVRYRVEANTPPWATLLGDARFAVERYSLDVYAVNFEFIWPRLMIAMQAEAKEDPCLAAVGAARARVDFAMMCLLLAVTVPLVWLPAVVALNGPGWLIPAIGGATPLALKLFYGMAVEGQLAFGDTVKTTIDKHRFLVLKLLRLANPATRAEERGLWTRIRSAEESGIETQLVYTDIGATR